MAAQGENVHGEADLVTAFHPRSVLDAGCGTGRVAVELARRAVDVVGVDLDESMLDRARAKAPDVPWVTGDLATVDLGRAFDLVLLAGNVMIYLTPGTEAAVVANLARHLRPSPRSGGRSGPGEGPGHLVAGFQLQPGRLDLDTYDAHAAAAGLVLAERWATWDRLPYGDGDYAVSVHRPAF
ncbi:MAG: class I SAM-dependent methyltransferase [Actinobacteria bacterium]|nr:class I SAM-dependent methyltransferase [Actinomycetota bacterium]